MVAGFALKIHPCSLVFVRPSRMCSVDEIFAILSCLLPSFGQRLSKEYYAIFVVILRGFVCVCIVIRAALLNRDWPSFCMGVKHKEMEMKRETKASDA